MAAEVELLHWIGGFVLGAGAYQYFGSKKDQKPNVSMLLLSGIAGIILVEVLLH